MTQTCDAVVEEARRRAIAAVSIQRCWRGAGVRRRQQAPDPTDMGQENLEETQAQTAEDPVACLSPSRANHHVGPDDVHQFAAAELMQVVDSVLFLAGTRTKAAVVIQQWERFRQRRQHQEEAREQVIAERLATSAVRVQALARGVSARRHASQAARRSAAAVAVQAFWRGLLGRELARSREFGVVFLQR